MFILMLADYGDFAVGEEGQVRGFAPAPACTGDEWAPDRALN
jgi:hypothetical protein